MNIHAEKSTHESVQPKAQLARRPVAIDPEQRCVLVSEAAYFLAEHRGFKPGHELEDWLVAEGEIDDMLTRGDIAVARMHG